MQQSETWQGTIYWASACAKADGAIVVVAGVITAAHLVDLVQHVAAFSLRHRLQAITLDCRSAVLAFAGPAVLAAMYGCSWLPPVALIAHENDVDRLLPSAVECCLSGRLLHVFDDPVRASKWASDEAYIAGSMGWLPWSSKS